MHRDTLAGGSHVRYVEVTCMHGLLSGLPRSAVFDGPKEAECPAACAPRASGPGPQGVGRSYFDADLHENFPGGII